MSLVTTKELLLDAQKNGYAVGAFNVENMEMVQAVVAAAGVKISSHYADNTVYYKICQP